MSVSKTELPKRDMGHAQKIRMRNIEKAKEILSKTRTENPTLQEPDIKQITIKEICNSLGLARKTVSEYYDLIT